MNDLIGKKLNFLTVVDILGHKKKNGRNRVYLKCICECGTITEIEKSQFGRTKSCGCIKHNKSFKTRDLAGQVFGKLSVLKECDFICVGAAQKRRKRWLCKCECGVEVKVSELSLLNNNTKSCGCYIKDVLHEKLFVDLTGKKYGNLQIIEFIERKNKHCVWKCSCDCGNIINVRANNILNGNTKSCGCYFKEKITKHGLSNNLKAYTKYLRSDPVRRLRHRVSCSIRKHFHLFGLKKDGGIFKYLPYTAKELKLHLESQFESWMTWENYGGKMNDKRKTWHIDHIIPQIKFNFQSLSDHAFVECWALTNLRPLEKIENVKKGDS